MERSLVPSMDLSKPSTHTNLEAAFGGESMANRKYLFFSEVAKQLGHKDLAKLFRDTACLLYTSPSPRDLSTSRMPSSA